jgi:hypothetical protein
MSNTPGASPERVFRRAGLSYTDLRDFIFQIDALGALRRIDGADPRYEIGGARAWH